jgi:hypothetical protein
MNVRKKRRHILLLYTYIRDTKQAFNERLKQMLSRKKKLIEKSKLYN